MTAIAGILLAAGAARRFGSPKLLEPLDDGVPLGVAAARALLQAVPRAVAVVRPGDHRLADAFTAAGLQVVGNPHADSGMASSLVAGIHATPDADGWLIALADMPWVQPATLDALVRGLIRGASMIAPTYRGRRGHPVGFSKHWKSDLLGLTGDTGGRELLARHGDVLELLDTADPGVLRDVDRREDLEPDPHGVSDCR